MDLQTIWVADHVAFSTVVHIHDYYQLIYCQKSGGSLEIDGVQYEAVPGYVYFIQPMQPHAMERGSNMRVIEIKFLAENAETAQRLRKLPSVFALPEEHAYRRTLKAVVSEGKSGALYCNETTNAALELLLLRLLRSFAKDAKETLHTLNFDLPSNTGSAASSNSDVQFIRLIDYIDKHLAEKITLDVLSEVTHFNKSYLVEKFKNEWGLPPMKYVNMLRMERAKELLTTTDKSITEIGKETGFQDIAHFSRTFKEKEGLSPQSYRSIHQEEIPADQTY